MLTAPEIPGFSVYSSQRVGEAIRATGQQLVPDWLAFYDLTHRLRAPLPTPVPGVLLVTQIEYAELAGKGVVPEGATSYNPRTDLVARLPDSPEAITEEQLTEGIIDALSREHWRHMRRVFRGVGTIATPAGIALNGLGAAAEQPVVMGIGVGLMFGGGMTLAISHGRHDPHGPPPGFEATMPPIQVQPI
jgi:hypothetical protein